MCMKEGFNYVDERGLIMSMKEGSDNIRALFHDIINERGTK